MMRHVQLNTKAFASQSFEEEVIVLDVTNGTYYALTGNAPDAWDSLLSGLPVTEVAKSLAARTGADQARVNGDLETFVSAMVSEKVLLPVDDASVTEHGTEPVISNHGPRTYSGFVWDKHSDLDELLVLDPIHEVDPDKGWPHAG